jgi:hypothetical protein
MDVLNTSTVKRAKTPERHCRTTFPIPLYLSEALYRQADNAGVTVTTLILDVLERELSAQGARLAA